MHDTKTAEAENDGGVPWGTSALNSLNLSRSIGTGRGNDVIQRFGDGTEVRVILDSVQILQMLRSSGKPGDA